MGFRVEIIGDITFKQELDEITTAWEDFKRQAKRTGREVRRFMIDYIKSNTKSSNKSNHHLYQAIDYNVIETKNELIIEIGDIAKLNIEAPWWKLVDKGGAHPMAGKFLPGWFTDAAGKKFIYDPGSNKGFIVDEHAIIPAMNYINNTKVYMNDKYRNLIAKLKIGKRNAL